MKTRHRCHRCGGARRKVDATSRINDEPLCTPCATAEAFEGLGRGMLPPMQWWTRITTEGRAYAAGDALPERLELVFKAHHPGAANTTGMQAWFRRELSNREGPDVSKKTIHLWLRDGLPSGRVQEVDRVLRELEAEAADKLESVAQELRR